MSTRTTTTPLGVVSAQRRMVTLEYHPNGVYVVKHLEFLYQIAFHRAFATVPVDRGNYKGIMPLLSG